MNYQRINCKNQNGITLIALVVTIVIMLILSGITIGIAFGDNGLIQTVQTTKKNQQIEIYKTQIEIIITNWEFKKAMNDNIGLDDLWQILQDEGIINNPPETYVKLDENGNYIITTSEGYEIEIPVDENGNVTGEGSLDGDTSDGSSDEL